MAKTQDEQFAAEEAAKRYIASKTTGLTVDTSDAPRSISTAVFRIPELHKSCAVPGGIHPLSKVLDMPSFGRRVSSCTLAHAVSIRGTETRTVSSMKLDFKACGLMITECDRGLEISYTGTDTTRYTFTTPWANVVQFSYEK